MRLYRYGAAALAGALLCALCMMGATAQDFTGTPFAPENGLTIPRPGRVGAGPRPVRITAEQMNALKALYILPASMPVPADNPMTADKVALGQKLFFDPALSSNGKLACASCHDVRRAFSGSQSVSVGVTGERLRRHTPTVINLAWSENYFWDGRTKTLEQQALMPIADSREMGMPHDVLVSRLKHDADYRAQFERVFPGEGVSAANTGKALAAFERALIYADSPFDRWIAGEESAISEAAKRGFVDFNTRAGCARCHSGWNFTDGKFHDIGLPGSDMGRFGVDGDEASKYGFKTPGLRNIAQRAPFMHAGQLGSLGAVMQFYNNGFVRRPTLSPEMRAIRGVLGVDMIAFLRTLSSPPPPELVRLQEALDQQTR